MNARDRSPRSYQPPVHWHTCVNPDCGVMWISHQDIPCWACGSKSAPSWQPKIGSKAGFAPADFDDPRPT